MEKRADITNELNELGSAIANASWQVPYQVPPGYFETLPGVMYALAQDSEPALPEGSRAQVFTVPDGYFDELPLLLLQKATRNDKAETDAGEELEALSPLLGGLSRKMPFSVPDNYFAGLNGSFIQENAEEPASFLNAARNKSTYTVPADYFDDLPNQILTLVKPIATGKVYKGRFGRTIVRYAAAAIIAGIVMTSGFFMSRSSSTQQVVSTKGLEEKASQTSDADILNYLENQAVPVPADLQMLSANAVIKDDAILEMLADVTDEELQQYLQAQSGSKQMIN